MGDVADDVERTIARSFLDVEKNLRKYATAFGWNMARFDQEWKKKFKVEGDEDFQEDLEAALGAYSQWVTGIDFEQFKKSGETIAQTIDAMLTSMLNIRTVTESGALNVFNDFLTEGLTPDVAAKVKRTWDMSDLYDQIDLDADTSLHNVSRIASLTVLRRFWRS